MRGCLLRYGEKIKYVIRKSRTFVERYVRIYEQTSLHRCVLSIFVTRFEKTERTAKLFINQFYYSMKKKIYGALVLGSLLLSGGMVSCSDYDDDINSLNERVDGIEKTLADLKAKIEAGAVITKVENTSNGVKVTLSNGESFELTNGKNGADGKPGSTVSVDSEGYWTIDGNRVTVGGKPIKAEGEKGDQGEAGTPGEDGKDGKWYEPNEDGFWYECSYNEEGEVVKTKTENQWVPATDEGVRVVYYPAEGYMLIYGAEGSEDKAIRIDITSDLKSLALIPYVIDSESGLSEIGFYNIIAKDGKIAESTDAKAHYRLNPANADVNAWEWSMIDRTAQVRATGDNVNDLLVISDTDVDAGELTVTLKSRKSLDGLAEDEIAIFALAGNNETTGEQIVSDYGKVVSKDLKTFSIINESLGKESAFDHKYSTIVPAKEQPADAQLVYDENISNEEQLGLDLNTLTWTWAEDITTSKVTLEDLDIDGLTYTFEKPKTYLGNDGVTNQQEFVVLEGSTVKVNEYGTAAIGRTPIFLAKALVNGKEVASGYIKLEIVEKDETPVPDKEDEILTVDCGVINYQTLAAGTQIKGLEWTVVNQFYAKYNLTVDKFRAAYKEPTAASVNAETGVKLTNNWWDDTTGTTTDAASIDMDPTKIAVVAKLGQKREATITFESKDKKVYPNVVVKFVYQIEDNVTFPELNPDYKIGENMVQVKGRLVGNKWTMISAIKEHFVDYLAGYSTPNNHKQNLVASFTNPLQTGASITRTNALAQNIQLTEALVDNHRDFSVDLNMTLANGEKQKYTYIVRFASPYTLSVDALTLKTMPAQVSKADLAKAVVVKGPNGEVIYQNGAVTSAADTYKFATSGYDFDYKLDGSETDSWASFGRNLTITDAGMISWANDGTVLQKDKFATSKVTLTVPNVVINNSEGLVKILSSAHSME